MGFMADESSTEKVLKILSERTEKARAVFKDTILAQETGIGKVDDEINKYLSQWKDTTRSGVLALACEAVGGNPAEVLPLQVALLFIDATMDIHDDIIDDSVSKKNRGTVYGKLGKGNTLLIGDGFMVKGFGYLFQSLEHLAKDLRQRVLAEVTYFLYEVVAAHLSEVALKGKKWRVKPNDYLQILMRKGADIEGRMKLGAICGRGSARDVDALTTYGRNVGVLLAAKSDFVDIFEPSELMHRIKYEVMPLQILYAIKSRKHGPKIREILQKDILSPKDCDMLLETIYMTKEIVILNDLLRSKEKEAVQALDTLADSRVKGELRLLIASLTEDY
uniref:Putative geranylgeranyl diphosphate synthase n=1 Tax=uncultured crenarchaeote MCG TaxID=529375 RepID=B2YI70_9CREN|nr:putative geranylgeranyl diphosphate synthase [uncultured crenarchaeote MCG]